MFSPLVFVSRTKKVSLFSIHKIYLILSATLNCQDIMLAVGRVVPIDWSSRFMCLLVESGHLRVQVGDTQSTS